MSQGRSTHQVTHPGERRWETNLLAIVTLVLTIFGIANCYAAAAYLNQWAVEAAQQVSGALIGGICFLIVAHLDYSVWQRIAKPLFYLTILALLPIAIAAIIWRGPEGAPALVSKLIPHLNGARRWLDLGVRIQVSEGARFTLAVFLSAYLADLGENRLRLFREGFLPVLGLIGLVAGLVLVEPSLSMAIVLSCIGGAILFAAGARVSHVTAPIFLGALGITLILKFEPVRAARFLQFLTPDLACDPLADQACNSLIGIGNGGVLGTGFGQGTQKLGHLPYGYSDFILSAIGEEWGFLGMVIVVLLFGVFCWVGLRIAKSARDPFGMYLATGITVSLVIGAFLHALVVLRMMPTTGLTLPFMSAGRLSLIVSMFSAGVLISIGRARGRPASRR